VIDKRLRVAVQFERCGVITDMMTSIFRKYRIIRAVHRLKPSKYAAEDRDRRVEAPMLIYLLAFVGGVLTILSPCILPVLPFVFARADQPFRRSGLPLLTGMALTFFGKRGLLWSTITRSKT
jgi:cytochrome c biogenesis protein CcdA